MGKIQIEGMEFYAFHGHFREEQIVGNHFLIDLEIETDLSAGAASDRLEDTLDYQEAYRIVKSAMQEKTYLLEHIGKRILDALYTNLEGIKKATVKIRKMNPSMGGSIASVGITLSR